MIAAVCKRSKLMVRVYTSSSVYNDQIKDEYKATG